jgi:hypothetical protein
LRSGFDFGVALEEFMDCFGGSGGVLVSCHDGDRLESVMISFLEIRYNCQLCWTDFCVASGGCFL